MNINRPLARMMETTIEFVSYKKSKAIDVFYQNHRLPDVLYRMQNGILCFGAWTEEMHPTATGDLLINFFLNTFRLWTIDCVNANENWTYRLMCTKLSAKWSGDCKKCTAKMYCELNDWVRWRFLLSGYRGLKDDLNFFRDHTRVFNNNNSFDNSNNYDQANMFS